MKQTNITKTITQYSDQCPYCDKIIKGTKDTQVNYLMKVHIMSKHPEKKE